MAPPSQGSEPPVNPERFTLDNTFTGGDGADTVVFADDWGADVILDFQNGLDKIDLSGAGFLFSDLSVGGGGTGAEIAAGTSTLLLAGIDVSVIDESNFVFV